MVALYVAHFQDLLDTKLFVFRPDTCASPNLIKNLKVIKIYIIDLIYIYIDLYYCKISYY